MRCEEVMKRTIQCLRPEQSVKEAASVMRDANVGFLPICDPSNKVLGTLTDRDIVIRAVADDRPTSSPVRDSMTEEVVACRPQDDLERAEELMRQHHKSRILVVDDDDRLIGVISLSDIVQVESEGGARTLREVSEREAQPPH
jgi:CBS domain-containing protein